jgi:small-conductance mechanosensitive channel
VGLGIFNIDTSAFLAISISLWAGILFAIGDIVKNLVESVIFLFFTHPYDVGDRVIIGGETLNVKEFGLMSTTFTKWDGSEIYSPNRILGAKDIHNMKRSGPMAEEIPISVGIATSQAKLDKLKEFMIDWIKEHELREILPVCDIYTNELFDSRRLDLSVILAHKVFDL